MVNITHTIHSYRKILGIIGNDKANMHADNVLETEVQDGIFKVISAIKEAENSLRKVAAVKKSYNEILKMVM